jgi:hypothetical protein
MVNWITAYKGAGPSGFNFKAMANQPQYNEGSSMATSGNTIWSMANQDMGDSPITPVHDPGCGYWTKGAGGGALTNYNLYIVDGIVDCVMLCNGNGSTSKYWGSLGSTAGKFNYPTDICTIGYPINQIYVTDQLNHRVQIFDMNGNFISSFGSYGTGNGQFNTPCGITFWGGTGLLYVVDKENNRIQIFDWLGNYFNQWGTYGTTNGKLYYPDEITITFGGQVYITDGLNHRVQVFDVSGNYITNWALSSVAYGITTYNNEVYVCDTYNSGGNHIKVFSNTGTLNRSWGPYGTGNGQFHTSWGIAIYNGEVFVSDVANQNIQVFTTAGVFKRSWQPHFFPPNTTPGFPYGILIVPF